VNQYSIMLTNIRVGIPKSMRSSKEDYIGADIHVIQQSLVSINPAD